MYFYKPESAETGNSRWIAFFRMSVTHWNIYILCCLVDLALNIPAWIIHIVYVSYNELKINFMLNNMNKALISTKAFRNKIIILSCMLWGMRPTILLWNMTLSHRIGWVNLNNILIIYWYYLTVIWFWNFLLESSTTVMHTILLLQIYNLELILLE